MRPLSSPLLRRGAIVAGVLALGMGTFASTALGQVDGKKTVINTFSSWDGSSSVVPFGCPETSNYGQVVTAPAKRHHFKSITFTWTDLTSGSMVVRGEVYAWNGTMATGSSLAESAPQTVTSGQSGFYLETFKMKASVTPGQQYVIFATIDKDYASCTDNYTTGWGLDGDVYSGGGFVFLNSDGDASQWTTVPWGSFGGSDLAFKAVFTK